MDEGQIVHAGREVWHQIADPTATVAVLFPVPGTFHAGPRFALEKFDLAARVEFLSVAFEQLRLVIEGIALAGGAGHEKLHHATGAGAVMQTAVELGARPGLVGEQSVTTEQMRESNAAEAAAKTPEELTAIDEPGIFRAEGQRHLLGGTNVF